MMLKFYLWIMGWSGTLNAWAGVAKNNTKET